MEFGAIDIVVDNDHTPHIIDANPTPGWGDERQEGFLEHLRSEFDIA
jgi:hypothetical protein